MKLLTPGPVTTRDAVRAAMSRDVAPWDHDFRDLTLRLRDGLLRAAGCDARVHAPLLLQGCGHFAMEAALRTFVAPGARVLVPLTGQYADRLARLSELAGRPVTRLPVPHGQRIRPDAVAAALRADPTITHVAVVQSETSSGVIHDVAGIAAVAGALGRRVLVDAVSAFGALELDLKARPEIDAAVFTANKCLESVPGIALVLARIDRLHACAGQAGSWSFDLADVHASDVASGGVGLRFTPPAQVLAALEVALDLHAREGRAGRLARYTENMRTLYHGVSALGLAPVLPLEMQGPIVLNVHVPPDPAWHLQGFVDALKQRGYVISNFSATEFPSFRIGCIGALTPEDMRAAVAAIGLALDDLGVRARRAA